MNTEQDILVIDDDSDLRFLISEFFTCQNYYVWEFGTTEMGLEHLKTHPHPKLIICDIFLNNGDGLDFIRQVRSMGIEAPVIVMTAFDRKESKKREALEAGATEFWEKTTGLLTLDLLFHRFLPSPQVGTSAR